MKTKYYITCLLAVLIGLTACNEDLLDINRHGVMPTDQYYKTDQDAEEALAIIYQYAFTSLYHSGLGVYPMLKNNLSDDVFAGGQKRNDQPMYEALNEFTFEAQNNYILTYFQNLYNLVYRCNLIIDNFNGDNSNTFTKKSAVAQAKVWRAWAYMELITLWGTPPLVDHCLAPDEYKQPNGDPQELWNLVTSDLTDAINSGGLEKKQSKYDKIATVTEGYAQALLGKAYVFMTYSLAGGAKGGNDAISAVAASKSSPYWKNAVEAFDKVINSGMYELYTGPFVDLLKTATNWCPENMFEFNHMWNTSNTSVNMTNFFEMFMIGWDSSSMTAYGKEIPCNRSSNFLAPRKAAYDAMVAWSGENNPRTYGSIRTYDQIVNNMGVGVKDGVYTIYACEGVFDMKFFRYEDKDCKTMHQTEKNYPMMRYAEVLLLAAEANLMVGNQAKADEYMNIVRRRAELPDMAGVTLSDIQQEKRCELYNEGVRGYDLIRWGLAPEFLGNQGGTVSYYTAYTAGATYDAAGNLVALDSTDEGTATQGGETYQLGLSKHPINESGYGFKAGKHELLPFPQNEILLSGEIVGGPLKQNPGW